MASRSYLFVPGIRPDRFPKAWNSGADVVILDLEDSVPTEQKAEARKHVAAWLSAEHPVYVRVNGTRTTWFHEDLAAVALSGLAGIVLPKAEEVADIADVTGHLADDVRVVPILETARGVWNALAVAGAPQVERLAFGALDFQLDCGIPGDDEELLYARSRLVLASRVAELPAPLAGVTVSLDDPERLRADVEQARRLGFGAKLCIHPGQVPIVNEGFGPTADEVAWARRVLEGVAHDSGALRVDGQMVDRPVIERAMRILEATEKGSL